MVVSRALDADPSDRNSTNTKTRPGDMMADSPVAFPERGALPSLFPPDLKVKSEPAEEGYYIFSSPCRSSRQIREIWKSMPKGTFEPPRNNWRDLEKTREILTRGGVLRLVALGDSIVNDTMRSGWLSLLAETYPGVRIDATVYVRGGGGCQHYRERNRIQENVVPRRPHLVLIGGISQKSVEDIMAVVAQLREALPEVEILLFSGTFGTTDPRDPHALANARHSGTGEYGLALEELAATEGCAYLDMTTPWAEYIRSSGLHPHRFYRDAVHANAFGEQILAKILMTYWSRENPAPR